ncbi:MAG: ATP phosphoribosyltransferase regulatory subunit [Acutalibacteraceae bacterium]
MKDLKKAEKKMQINKLKTDEKIALKLRSLYRSYGYMRYKVNKFEEYDLYMQNKSFLTSEQILAFSDTNGKLMALKPDITLSIIKNTKDDETTKKLCYAENVYRVPKNSYGFREIMQTGLECIGKIDIYSMGEVLMLAAKSLEIIDKKYVLDISDMGIVSGILESEKLGADGCSEILKYISEKNLHGLAEACAKFSVSEKTEKLLKALITVYGPLESTVKKFENIGLPQHCGESLENLKQISELAKAYQIENVNLDFSVVNDMNYYNGIIFNGFISGIPSSVLSGGRYDLLMAKMGKSSGAIGFAVYLDQLEMLANLDSPYDFDTLIVYDGKTDPKLIAQTASKFVGFGKSVRVQRGTETSLKYRDIVRLDGIGEK